MKKRVLGTVVVQLADAVHGGEDADVFAGMLKDFCARESKGFAFASFKFVEKKG